METILVLAILATLVGLLLSAIQRVRSSASKIGCANNLKQIGLALHNYHDANGGLPPRKVRDYKILEADSLLSWQALILPQMGEDALWSSAESACRVDGNAYHNPPHNGFSTVVKTYICPADGRLTRPMENSVSPMAAFSSYIGCAGTIPPGTSGLFYLNGVFGSEPGRKLTDISDGLSQTLLVGERPPPDSLQAGFWYPSGNVLRVPHIGPDEYLTIPHAHRILDMECFGHTLSTPKKRTTANPCDRLHFWSLHSGGMQFAMADGSVRFLTDAQSESITALATRSGGEVVPDP